MALPPQKEEKLKAYVTKALDLGFSLTAIEAKLKAAGYKEEDIRQIRRSFAAPKQEHAHPAKFLWILLGIAVLTGMIFSAWFFIPQSASCTDEECFRKAANACETASFKSTDVSGTALHEVQNCQYTRTMTEISEDEPAEVRDLFLGKSMICDYAENEFPEEWLSSISLGLERCSGELKDAIDAVVKAQEELGII